MRLGSGALFTSRLAAELAAKPPTEPTAADSNVDTAGLTPAIVQTMPEAVQDIVVNAYSSALARCS